MRRVTVSTFEEWRSACRGLLAARIPPADVVFTDDTRQQWLGDLLDELHSDDAAGASQPDSQLPASSPFRVPPAFLELAREVACYRDSDRFNLLYRALWRITHGQPDLLEIATDPEVHRLLRMQKAIARDVHKMHAFVRFRKLSSEQGDEYYVAWHQPDHRIVQLAAPFFSRRFPSMRWSILTPDACAHWDLHELTYSEGVSRSAAPSSDQLEDLWRIYYRSIFNPARLSAKTMKREMPVRHWKNLPETMELPALLAEAGGRVQTMVESPTNCRPTTVSFIPPKFDLPTLREAACHCRGCSLCGAATQTVFGEGPAKARLVLVGEQPGDEEDHLGRPFAGPAGQVLDEALAAAGVDREQIYLTNAVKHFKFEQRGKRRLHQRPTTYEIEACRPWLLAELSQLRPQVLVCLGATAVQTVLRSRNRLSELRGRVMPSQLAPSTIATYHPSAVLRATSEEHAAEIRDALVADLRLAKRLLNQTS